MALKRSTDTQLVEEKDDIHLLIFNQVEGRSHCYQVSFVKIYETISSADLGGSSKYSNENFED